MYWEEINTTLSTWTELMVDNLFSLEKRTSYLYLITTLILAYYVYWKSGVKSTFLKYLFHRKVWLSNSARIDYLIIAFNGLVKILVITPMLFIAIWLQLRINELLLELIGPSSFELSAFTIVAGYTVCIWIFNDLGTYVIHYLFHRVPFLWEFHKIHHSATTMTPFTLYRIHPVEIIINNLKRLIVYGLVTGPFYYLANGEVGTLTFVGVNVFTFIFMFFGANLRHSHVKLTFPNWLESILISPFQHQIHHSDNPTHFNKNLGSHLAIWDKLFGTLVTSKETPKVRFGLGNENKHYTSFWKSIWVPFKNLFN